MRIILDTGVLSRPDAIRDLAEQEHHLILPSLALAEHARFIDRAGHSLRDLLITLRMFEVEIEPLDVEQVHRLPRGAHEDHLWEAAGREALIASHLQDHDIVWTTNPDDFLALGLRPGQVRDCRA